MSKRHVYEINDRTGTVKFPKGLTLREFELCLSEAYSSTVSGRPTSIIFDLANVEWCEVFCLAMLSLWILETRESGRHLLVRMPINNRALVFLSNYRFQALMNSYKIPTDPPANEHNRALPALLGNAPFFPLVFQSQNDYSLLMEKLRAPGSYQALIADVAETEIVRSGAIRDVILHEIGENAFTHGTGRFAHIVMTRLSRMRYFGEAGEWEGTFANKMHGQPVVEIVIGDKGPGIAGTLTDAYMLDPILDKKGKDPTECDILEYAFMFHSSRRSLKDRLGAINPTLRSDSLRVVPPTGLHRLRETIRKYHGFLQVRSGASTICYDFLENQFSFKPMRSDEPSRKQRLAQFGGTQFRIILPVVIPQDRLKREYFDLNVAKRVDDSRVREYVRIADYFNQESVGTLEQEAKEISEFQAAIEKKQSNTTHGWLLIIVDFELEFSISLKVFHVILAELIQRQETLLTFVCVNIEDSLLSGMARLETPVCSSQIHPLFVFTNKLEAYCLDLLIDTGMIVSAPLRDIASTESKYQEFAAAAKHIYNYNGKDDRYELRYTIQGTERYVCICLRARIEMFIREPSNGIYYRDIKVLLPSRAYACGYFETFRLRSSALVTSLVVEWAMCEFVCERSEIIVTIGTLAHDITEKALSKAQLSIDSNSLPIHINVSTGPNFRDDIHRILGIEKDRNVIVFTDVVATERTVTSVLDVIVHTRLCKVICIVDAGPLRRTKRDVSSNTKEYILLKGKEIVISSIVRESLDYEDSLPPEWSYGEVYQVDPATHLLVKNRATPTGPLTFAVHSVGDMWKNDFLDDIVIPTGAWCTGHFTTFEKHLTYIFDVPNIAQNSRKPIVDSITLEAKNQSDALKSPITHVFYPSYNPGINRIAQEVSDSFENCIVFAVSEGEFRSSLDQIRQIHGIKAAIAIDDATLTGDSAFRLVDICDRYGAQLVIGFILINRGNEYQGRRIEKLSKYGSTDVRMRYIAHVQLPAHPIASCPICFELRRAEVLEAEFTETPWLRDIFTEIIGECAEKKVADVVKIQTKVTPLSELKDGIELQLRWLIEIARTTPAVRHQLTEYAKRFTTKRKEALILLCVFARERILQSMTTEQLKEFMYPSLKDALTECCRAFLSQLTILSRREIDSVLSISEVCMEGFLLYSFESILNKAIASPITLMRILAYALRSDLFLKHPGITLSALQRFRNSINVSQEIIQAIDDVVDYWEHAKSTVMRNENNRLECYKELRGGRFHQVGHLAKNLLWDMINDLFVKEQVIRSWARYQGEISSIIGFVRRTIASGVTPEACVEATRLLAEIDGKLYSVDLLIRQLPETHTTPPTDTDFQTDLQDIVRIIESIKHSTDALKRALGFLETNVKSAMHAIIQQHETNLQSAGISIVRDFPDELCLVYAEDSRIREAIHNLIDNAVKHSAATQLVVGAVISDTRESVLISIVDNGQGSGAGYVYGTGLEKVKEIASSYYGRLTIMPASQFKGGQTKHGTFVEIRLPFLPHLSEGRH